MTAVVLQTELPLERPVHRLGALAQPGGERPWVLLIAAGGKHSGNAQLGHVGGEVGPGESFAAHQHQFGTPVEAVVGFVYAERTGAAVVLITHRMASVRMADRIHVLD